ncbi:MAG: DnaD domain protein [Oscillospiraceae bacterium]
MFILCNNSERGSLPDALVKRYRSADGPALKVALFLVCEGESSSENISDSLALPLETVERALIFWTSAGLVYEQCDTALQKVTHEPKKRARRTLTSERAGELALRDPNVSVLMQETQSIIGRTLDNLESRILLEIYECDELPVDVILMITAYCMPRIKNKRSLLAAVARTASDWSDEGVCNATSAEQRIKLLEMRERREIEVAKALGYELGSFNKSQRAAIARWYEELGFDASFAREAHERTGNDSIAYINTILKSWHKKGYRTIKDTYSEVSNAPTKSSRANTGGDSLLKTAVLGRNNGGEH